MSRIGFQISTGLVVMATNRMALAAASKSVADQATQPIGFGGG